MSSKKKTKKKTKNKNKTKNKTKHKTKKKRNMRINFVKKETDTVLRSFQKEENKLKKVRKIKSKNCILIILYIRRLLIIYFFCLKINNKVI